MDEAKAKTIAVSKVTKTIIPSIVKYCFAKKPRRIPNPQPLITPIVKTNKKILISGRHSRKVRFFRTPASLRNAFHISKEVEVYPQRWWGPVISLPQHSPGRVSTTLSSVFRKYRMYWIHQRHSLSCFVTIIHLDWIRTKPSSIKIVGLKRLFNIRIIRKSITTQQKKINAVIINVKERSI